MHTNDQVDFRSSIRIYLYISGFSVNDPGEKHPRTKVNYFKCPCIIYFHHFPFRSHLFTYREQSIKNIPGLRRG